MKSAPDLIGIINMISDLSKSCPGLGDHKFTLMEIVQMLGFYGQKIVSDGVVKDSNAVRDVILSLMGSMVVEAHTKGNSTLRAAITLDDLDGFSLEG